MKAMPRSAPASLTIRGLEALLNRDYVVPRAKEFGAHGFSRRFKTMRHCIESVFAILPPEREDLPNMDELVEAVVHV
jgi:hypothetical protein